MLSKLNGEFEIISPIEVKKFLNENDMTIDIINAVEPHLNDYFPNAEFSLEISNELKWTNETKLLLNVCVTEDIFFNGMLDHFNEIYARIEPIIQDILCPIVLFPQVKDKQFDRMNNNSAINLIARTAYFNNDYEDGSVECEIRLRDIPKEQQKQEIIEYCNTHEDIFALDIEEELQIDFMDICEILEELENEGIIKEIK